MPRFLIFRLSCFHLLMYDFMNGQKPTYYQSHMLRRWYFIKKWQNSEFPGLKTPSVKRFQFDWIWNYYRSISGSNLQLGEVQHSFGYGGTGKAAENCVFKNYGSRFGVGDILGCYLVSFRLAVEPNEMIKSHLWLTASLFFVQQLEIFVPTTQTTIFKLIVQIIFALVINETREWRVGRRPHSIC